MHFGATVQVVIVMAEAVVVKTYLTKGDGGVDVRRFSLGVPATFTSLVRLVTAAHKIEEDGIGLHWQGDQHHDQHTPPPPSTMHSLSRRRAVLQSLANKRAAFVSTRSAFLRWLISVSGSGAPHLITLRPEGHTTLPLHRS